MLSDDCEDDLKGKTYSSQFFFQRLFSCQPLSMGLGFIRHRHHDYNIMIIIITIFFTILKRMLLVGDTLPSLFDHQQRYYQQHKDHDHEG